MPEEVAKKKRLWTWLISGAVCVAAVAGGFFVPIVIDLGGARRSEPDREAQGEAQPALLPFTDPVVVNLAEERLGRYLRVKLMLVVDAGEEQTVEEMLKKKKVFLKNWLLSYLSDQTLQGITGAAGQNRVRREIRDQFNAMLFPNGAEKIADVLFEEFNVQ